MNKTAIKNFAIWARNKLRADIILKAGLLGITDKGIVEPSKQSTDDLQIFDIGTSQPVQLKGKTTIEQRKSLVAAIKAKQLKHAEAFDAVIEEVAYTWFNRLIAVRFMEVNDYLPGRVRVLSSDNPAKAEPDFVTNPFDTDLEFTEDEINLIDNLKDNNKSDELFQFLFIKQCNKLNEILPELFEKTNDYTELLLNVSFTDKDGVVYHLVHDISEGDFNVEKEGQVEIIGWLYQYYNIEPKDKVFGRPSGQKIRKEDVPAATQLFTPDWIVRYMVENSLGRLVISGQCLVGSEKELAEKFGWKYYLPEAEQTSEVSQRIKLTTNHSSLPTLKLIDPCMGSGHILVYAFDVFMDIYRMQGYTDREAVRSILENNLFGLEIDDRATQLAYFSIMMKARSYDRRFLTRKDENGKPDIPKLNICSIQESNLINAEYIELFGELKSIAQKLLDEFIDAKEYGSILNLSITKEEILQLEEKYAEIDNTVYTNFFDSAKQSGLRTAFAPLLKQAKIMTEKYDVVCTNPPYMGGSGMDSKLSTYVKKNYPDTKADLFAVFIEKCIQLTKQNCYTSMVTMQSWMFLSSFEKMCLNILRTKTITNLMHMENMVMGIAFGTAVTVFKNSVIPHYKGTYNFVTLKDIENSKPKVFPNYENRFAQVSTENFSKIPGSPIAYWVSDNVLKCYKEKSIYDYAKPCKGIDTGDNNLFLRLWFEVEKNKKFTPIGVPVTEVDFETKKWFPYNKGGEFRKWYGNNEYVLNWEFSGQVLRNFKGSNLRNKDCYFRKGITWSTITSGDSSFRYFDYGFLFDNGGSCLFAESRLLYIQGLLNSVVSKEMLSIQPTINNQPGTIGSIPLILSGDIESVENVVRQNIDISRCDWDSFETSWDFKEHPLVRLSKDLWDATAVGASMHYYYGGHPKVGSPVELCYMLWQGECNERFNKLKANEEELNRIFIDIYGLGDELTPEVEDKDVTVRKADLQRDMRSFISYAVGCMFGRYSLDTEGLAYAGGEWDSEKYKSFIPDEDNCIPITDTTYFEDDIVGRFTEFVKIVYGEDTLEANLEFISKALGNKGNTSRDIIRNYFLNDFFKDHCKIYQKRPIYWLFDSGKQNGFKALCYMHRWNADTIGNMRVEYLHRIQRTYEKEIEREQDTIDNTTNNRDKAAAIKRKEKLLKQLKEAKDYDAKVAHLALSRPDIDLDDGVKVNYEKVQTAQDGKKLQILAKI